jgi:hypothetical protein
LHTEKLALGILPIGNHHTLVGCKRLCHHQWRETAKCLISSRWWCIATWQWRGLTWHCRALFQCNRGHSWTYLGYRTCRSLHNFSCRAKDCVVSWLMRQQPPETEVTSLWRSL